MVGPDSPTVFRLAEAHSPYRTEDLNRLEGLLEESRLAKEDSFIVRPGPKANATGF